MKENPKMGMAPARDRVGKPYLHVVPAGQHQKWWLNGLPPVKDGLLTRVTTKWLATWMWVRFFQANYDPTSVRRLLWLVAEIDKWASKF